MAKSPFAAKKFETYTYPAPLDTKEVDGEKLPDAVIEAREEMIDPEVTEDEALPWVKFRIPRAKSDLDQISDLTQSLTQIDDAGATFQQRVARGNRGVFELLVESWSFDRDPNGAAFDELDVWASDWISFAMGDALRQGQHRGYQKKGTSTRSSSEPASSPDKSPDSPAEE